MGEIRLKRGTLLQKKIIIVLFIVMILPPLYSDNGIVLDGKKIIATLEESYGEMAAKRGRAWLKLMQPETSFTEIELLQKVNVFFNGIRFIDDDVLWGVDNYWATPVEFIGVNGGDCEDFAIAKYFTLIELGVADEKLRITIVQHLTLNQYHMVLAYYETPESIPLVLDNIDGEIKRANERKDLLPTYSFNGKQLWLNSERNGDVSAGKASRLTQWRDLRERMNTAKPKQPKLKSGVTKR
jgi:predicted transglutaminase-like cysteine proteinase